MQAQGGMSVQRMCELAQVSRASFYRSWLEQEPDAAEMAVREQVQRVALEHRSYGYRRVKEQLRQEGVEVGAKIVRRLMREDNLLAVRQRKFVRTTDSGHNFRVYPNLAQYLELNQPNQLWVADITYVRLMREFVFVAIVLDAFSRRSVGWAVGRTLEAKLPLAALNRAIESRQPKPGLIHHSDQGSQYASNLYVSRLEAIQAVPSMSRAGRPWENGACESFIKTLKLEEIDARSYASLEQLEQNIEQFLEGYYNPRRLHSALGYLSPVKFEQQQAHAPGIVWTPAKMSFPRHEEIYPDAPSN
jgi:transposase InsO family protein